MSYPRRGDFSLYKKLLGDTYRGLTRLPGTLAPALD